MQNNTKMPSRSLNWAELRNQVIVDIALIKHQTGKQGYEATLQDGNKVLFYQKEGEDSLTFIKKYDQTQHMGYSNEWVQQGVRLQVSGVKIQDVQIANRIDHSFNIKKFKR